MDKEKTKELLKELNQLRAYYLMLQGDACVYNLDIFGFFTSEGVIFALFELIKRILLFCYSPKTRLSFVHYSLHASNNGKDENHDS